MQTARRAKNSSIESLKFNYPDVIFDFTQLEWVPGTREITPEAESGLVSFPTSFGGKVRAICHYYCPRNGGESLMFRTYCTQGERHANQ